MNREYFFDGFYFGLGITFSFFAIAVISYFVIKLLNIINIRSNNNGKLSIGILKKYEQELLSREKYGELEYFKVYTDHFKNGDPMIDFFKKYEVVAEKKDSSEYISFFQKTKLEYRIKKKKS